MCVEIGCNFSLTLAASYFLITYLTIKYNFAARGYTELHWQFPQEWSWPIYLSQRADWWRFPWNLILVRRLIYLDRKNFLVLISCKGMQNRYEDDEILGHRLYREIRRVEQIKKEPGKRSRGKGGSSAISVMSYQWETVASSFDEFDDVAVSFEFSFSCLAPQWIIKCHPPLLWL